MAQVDAEQNALQKQKSSLEAKLELSKKMQ